MEDLLLLVRVYQAQGNYGEAISIVEDARAGSITGIGKNQWELVRKLIDLFESANRWEELFSLCDRLLDEAQQEIAQRMFEASGYPFGSQGDDWKVWQGLIKAASKISTRELVIDSLEIYLSTTANIARQPRLAEKLILEYPSGKDGSRNARFALLEFYSRENATGTNCQDKLLAACYDYFRDFSAKFSCFQDLKPYFAHLEREKQEKLLSIANDLAWDSRPKATDSDVSRSMLVHDMLLIDHLVYQAGVDHFRD